MDSIRDITGGSNLQPSSKIANSGTSQVSFKDTLKSLTLEVNRQLKEADRKAEEFALGKKNDLHEVMIASEKADLSLRFLLQIRNKLLEAYQEIMRMNF
jgi:flagellar hook-basal body complex protein FliE